MQAQKVLFIAFFSLLWMDEESSRMMEMNIIQHDYSLPWQPSGNKIDERVF